MTHRDWTIPALPPEASPPAEPPAPPPCRCGGSMVGRSSNARNLPPRDLRDDLNVRATTITARDAQHRLCFTCDHGVGIGGIRTSYAGSAVQDFYHRECVVTDPLAIMPGDVVVATYTTNAQEVAVGRLLVLDTHYPIGARPQARLRAPDDLVHVHRDPDRPDTYRVYADTVGRITDPAIVAEVRSEKAHS